MRSQEPLSQICCPPYYLSGLPLTSAICIWLINPNNFDNIHKLVSLFTAIMLISSFKTNAFMIHRSFLRWYSYMSLSKEVIEDEDCHCLLEGSKKESSKSTRQAWPWMLLTCLFGTTTLAQFIWAFPGDTCDKFQHGFQTDLGMSISTGTLYAENISIVNMQQLL